MPTDASTLPQAVADHLAACNAHDAGAMMATFAADALVVDAGRELIDRAAIRRWVEREIVAPKVTMELLDAVVRTHAVMLRAKIDGGFDKTGLPDPLVLTYHFGLAGGRIAQLVVTLNKPGQQPPGAKP